jgi:outer membrane protein
VAVSKRMRPILNEARLQLLRGDLELVKTRNGLLPLMDLFITLGKSGYASSFGESVDRIDDDSYDALAGVRFNTLFSTGTPKRHRRAQLTANRPRMRSTT